MKKLTSILAMGALAALAITSQASAVPTPMVANTPAQVSAVPEPGAWAMMIIGIALVGFAMRRRAKAAAV